jgi:hypothetical protein
MSDGVTRTEQIEIRGFSAQPGHGAVSIVSYDPATRWRRALKALGICWAAALLSIPVFIAHWFLVPGFLCFGVFMLYQRLSAHEVARDARGTCPDCGAEQSLEVASRWHVPQQISCRQCHRGLQVTTPATRTAP